MLRMTVWICCGCLGLLAACTGSGSTPGSSSKAVPEPGRSIAFDEANNGQTVRLGARDVLIVRLAVQLGTGFGWSAAQIPTGLSLAGEPTVEGQTVAGGEQRQQFRFEVRGKGGGMLVLELRRPWEKDVPPASTYRLMTAVE